MRPLRFHLLRFLEWLAQRDVARANERIRMVVAFRNRRIDDAERYGAVADAISPPAEWQPRLWQRDHDPRSDTEDRRP